MKSLLFCMEFASLVTLQYLVHSRVSAFPKISGPKSLSDRIAIIGAGPSGVHMALLLKQAGFTDVTIYEASSRIGGKSTTIIHRSTPHDMGTVYLAPDYGRVIDLVHKYTGAKLIDLLPASVLLDGNSSPIDFDAYMVMKTIQNGYATDPTSVGRLLGAAIYKYIALHRSLFGDQYDYEIMPEPSDDVMTAISGTFLDFLRRNQLETLVPLFLASHVAQGYGYLDEVPALYGLLWNTPKLMSSMLGRLQGARSTGLYLLNDGFQQLWETIARTESLKIEFKKKVYLLERLEEEKGVLVKFIDHSTKELLTKFFDFVVWTPEMKGSLKFWSDVKDQEAEIFSKMEPVFFTTTLTDTSGMKMGKTPIDYFADNMSGKRDHSISALRDSYGALREQQGTAYQNGLLPTGDDNSTLRATVIYQYGKTKPSQDQLRSIRSEAYTQWGLADQKEVASFTWRYFPRFPTRQISSKILWRILDMQGKFGMWYIGSSVCFESVKSVVDYNLLLMNNFDIPSRKKKS